MKNSQTNKLTSLDISEHDVYVFPASFAQRRMWFLDQFQPGSPFYNIPMAVRIKGALRAGALEHAIQEIARRHESLRTTFAVMDGEPVQVINSAMNITLDRVNLRSLSEREREDEIHRRAIVEAQRPFNLAEGPLLRATLLKLREEDHALLLTMHHIVSDAWSLGVFIRELAVLYDAFSKEKPSPLPDLSLQYADFTEWQREWLQGEVMEAQLDYWRERLGDNPPPLMLPTDFPRPAVQTSRGAKLSLSLPKPLAKSLQELSRREGATLFMTLLAAFQVLLHRYTGQDDISVGTPVANRNRAEIEAMIGCFINTLVMRTNLSGDPSFRELLRRAREVALGAYANQDIPFEKLVEELKPERDMSRPSLFQVMLILQNTPGGVEVAEHGLTLSALKIDKKTANFDLTLTMVEEARGLSAAAEYNTDLFEAATIERLLQHFQTLLEGVVANPDQRITSLPILPEAEKRRLLVEWNGVDADYSLERCIHQLFEAQAERAPDAVAVVCEGSCLTYGELNRRANQLAHHLRELGVEPETPVGICVERSAEMVIGAMATLKAGGAYTPLDPAYPEERLKFMLNDAQAKVLLTRKELRIADCGLRIATVCFDTDWETIARESAENPNPTATAENLAYVIYTSGSTGQSKGVMVSHDGLVNAYLAWERAYELGRAATCHLQMASFPFDVCAGDMIRALCSGGKLVICPRDSLLDAGELYALMRRESVDCAEFVPAVMRNLMAHLEVIGESLDFMRVLVVGSDVWYASEYQRCLRLCGARTRLINSFGLTETTIDSAYFEDSGIDLPADRVTPIGRPFPNTQIYVLDSNLQPAPIGVYGEIFVGGPGVARGYRGKPDLTAEKFIPNPFSKTAGARLYKTGDLARWLPGGDIEFAGRCDDQVKIRGFRIEIGEIEAALGEHSNLREAVAAVREDQPGEKRLAAYFVPASEPAPTPGELRRFLLERLPEYLVPSSFTRMDGLPLTPNGKIDRRALPAPEPSRRESDEDFVAPRTPVEEMLAGVWMQVLKIGAVSVHDNFFAIGGHSLLATQVNSRLRDAFNVDLPLRNIFEFPTIAGFAEKIEMALAAKSESGIPPLRPAPRDQDLPLSFAQERLWFLDQLTPGAASYNIAEAYRLSGPLNVDALERSLNEIVRRHEALRTTFATVDSRPVQMVAPELRLNLPVIDLRGTPERKIEAERLAAEEARKPFDLARGPLVRATLLRLGEEEHAVLLTVHHIVSDDWSTFVYLREIAILYDAFVAGRPSPLPELPIQYADYACWQRQSLQGDVLENQRAYWKWRLAGAPPSLDLPTNRPRPTIQSSRGASQSFVLTEELSAALAALSRQEGATMFMTLLAAFQTLLHRYTGQDDIIVGSPVTNRNRSELEGLIGFFVNTLALRGDLSGAPSFRELLRRVRETALEAYAHQDMPFEKLVQELQPNRDLSRTPIFQAMLVMQNIPRQSPELARQGLSLSSMKLPSVVAKFDLTLFMTESGGRLSGALNYNTDLFDDDAIARMLDHFRNLLESIADDPDRRIAALPMLSEAEERLLLAEWSGSRDDAPLDRCLHQLFEDQVERAPDAIAVIFEDESLSYRELNQRANQMARYLRKLGVEQETLVGVCLDRSIEMMVGLLGVLKVGGAYVPLDPNYPADRLTFMIEDSCARLILTQKHLMGLLQSQAARLCCLDDEWPVIARESEENLETRTAAENLAYVIYTSGSTGRPKGTLITHRGLTNYLNWCLAAYPVAAGRGSVVHSTIAFDATITALFAPLLAGRAVRMLPEGISLDALADTLRREGDYSLIKITPAHLDLLSHQLSREEACKLTKAFVIGGENLLKEQIRFWQEHAGETHLFNEYGPTEAVVGCVVYDAMPDAAGSGSVPIGRPIPNTQVYALDQYLRPVPAGARGELYLGGVGLARGYLDRAELTAEKFIPHPFSDTPGERLYRTGDVVRFLPDGKLEFLGRADEQVKIRGYRVECGEIESLLCQHEGVREAVVIAREDVPGDRRLVAYCVAQVRGELPAHGDLRNFLKERLPEYMIPSFFIELEALPLTLNGKVDRRALPAPDKARPELKAEFVAPRTPAEERLAAICADVLGLERVGVHDHFFELGGHSLLATQVVSRVRQAFEIELPLRSLFETPTVAGLAENIETILWAAKSSQAPPGDTAHDREEGEI
ncbi:MAG: Linear gramicidin synthase subunit D [Acidobacteria bacterium]|nr:Linear gramicidin synthase subunit D [Acidobacteriota bacterium]